ncbi:MAG: sulfatase-like hydrolase/transferase [Spirochaetes bacterium]|nr:sulfatase-like hydrolase/transferase [Spirochaetota bacterium]
MKPNILFFFTDDQRYNTIHALGNNTVKTPHLDELVGRGTAFTHAHIPGGTCGAICMPSRAMLHSGRTLFHIQKEGQDIPREHTTMGEAFRAAGYNTFATGKWHNGKDAFARSFSSGDDIFFGGMNDHWNVPLFAYDTTGAYNGSLPQVRDWEHSNEVVMRSGDHVHAGQHSTDIFTDAAVRYLSSYNDAKPFFMYVPLMSPHDPRTMPARFREQYAVGDIPLPGNFLPEYRFDAGSLKIRDEKLADYPRKPGDVQRHLLEYYAMISHLDDGFGRIIDTLKRTGRYDSTIIVFAGDNGLAVGCHGLMGKQSLYEHSIRVPLIFAGPGIPENERREAYVYLSDIFPTLCEAAGIDIPRSVEGVSLSHVLADAQAQHHKVLYHAYADTMRGVKNKQYKLIEYAAEGRIHTELFDFIADPDEMTDLAADAAHAETVRSLRREMLILRDRLDDKAHPTGKAFWSARTDIDAAVAS